MHLSPVVMAASWVLFLAVVAEASPAEYPPRWKPEGTAYDVGYDCHNRVAMLYQQLGREDPAAAAELFARRHAGDPRQAIFEEGCRDALLGKPNRYDVGRPTARDYGRGLLEAWQGLGSLRWVLILIVALGALGGTIAARLAAGSEGGAATRFALTAWCIAGGFTGFLAFAASALFHVFFSFLGGSMDAIPVLGLAMILLFFALSAEYSSVVGMRRVTRILARS